MAFASSASATTLEVGGVAKNSAVTITASAAGSISLTGPFGELINICTSSSVSATTTTPFTGTRVGGPISSLSFSSCTRESVVVDAAGSYTFEAILGTTNATMFWDSASVTTPSPFGTLLCTTSANGTHIGTLTGVAIVRPRIHLNCSGFTVNLVGEYLGTSPVGLGAVS